ncbi:MAG: hypothetical protein NVV67_03500 [Pseudoxanthomonas sp.]|nr:hypothetical protein [Pseudoxanthomonas sp.]
MALSTDAAAALSLLRAACAVPEAFLALFKLIDGTPNGRFGWLGHGEGAVSGDEFAREDHRWRPLLRRSIGEETEFPLFPQISRLEYTLSELAAGEPMTSERSKDLVIGLRVLDAAFHGVHPGEVLPADDKDGFVNLRTKVRMGAPLFEADGLKVFPKPRRVNPVDLRGQGRLTDLLSNLAVVASGPHLEVVNIYAFTGKALGPSSFSRIGVIPAIDAHTELLWRKEAHNRYSVEQHPGFAATVQARVRDALNLLADRNVELVLLPELVSSPALIALLGEELASRSLAGQPNPHLVLAGTQLIRGGTTSRNQALVLNGSGDTLWRQDKLHAYRFTAHEQTGAGLPMGSDELADRIEAIDVEPRVLHIVDLSASQRIVVLTCEDFVQPDPHSATIADIAATTLLVPIMSGARRGPSEGWIHDAAMGYIRRPGATCVVANSGALLGADREGWQFGHIAAVRRVSEDWEPLPDAAAPIAWLAELPHSV